MAVKGIVERVVSDVAWGEFEDGQTFDIPAFGAVVGDEVLKMLPPDDDTSGVEVCFCHVNEHRAHLLYAVETPEGLEIVGDEILTKDKH